MFTNIRSLTVMGLILWLVGHCAAEPPAIIKPDLVIHPISTVQPLGGEVDFGGAPGIAAPCTVTVKLTSYQRLTPDQSFRVVPTGAYGFDIAPDTVVWKSPIDSGSTFATQFVFQPRQVGTYQFSFSHRLRDNWLPLASLILAVDEDGKTQYAGSAADYRLTVVPPHPQLTNAAPDIHYYLYGSAYNPLLDRQFTGDFRLSAQPRLNDTTWVDYSLECHTAPYTKVQFILDHSTTIKVSALPDSWGNSISLADSSRFYHGRFWFVPLKVGVGVLNLRVVGNRPNAGIFERTTTEFPIYFVTGDDGAPLFIGDFDPWTRFKNPQDPMLGSFSKLASVTNRDYTLKQEFSKPDYMGEATDTGGASSQKRK